MSVRPKRCVSMGPCRVWVFLWLGFCGCSQEHGAAPIEKRVAGEVSLSGESLAYVRVEPVAAPEATVRRPLLARIGFDEQRVSVLGAPVSGRVTAVNVVTGTEVRAGSALLTIHSGDVAQVRSQLAQAREVRALSELKAARAQELVTLGAGSEAESQEASTALASARTEERRARNTLGALGGVGEGADYVLRSPIAGTVVERHVDVGNAVGADLGQPLVTVADLASVWVVADIYEQDLAYVRVGQNAHITVPVLSERGYDGKITYVGQVVDPNTRTALARVMLHNPDGALRPGMFVEMVVEVTVQATGIVPSSALLSRRDQMFLFVEVKPNLFRQRKVQTGAQSGDHVVILSGVAAGERVVTRGAILLDAEANAAF